MITEIYKIGTECCGPCKQLDKELKDFNLVPVKFFDAEDNTNICDQYNIKNVPTLLFMNKEKCIYKNVGFMTKDQIINKIKELNELH